MTLSQMTEIEEHPPASSVIEELRRPERVDAVADIKQAAMRQEAAFSQLARRASAIFDAQIAQVTLLEANIQRFVCSVGYDADQAPAETSFCAHVLTDNSPATVVLDAKKDPRFANIPFVIGEPSIRFYVGCPIRFRSQKVGTLCVYDSRPRESITSEQKRILIELSWDASQIIDTTS